MIGSAAFLGLSVATIRQALVSLRLHLAYLVVVLDPEASYNRKSVTAQ